SIFFKALGLATGFLLVLLGWDEGGDEHAAEYHGCLLLIVAGTMLAGCANDLVTLFLALELVSIPTYVLLYLPRQTAQSQEAAVKYFLLSIFSSALLLFGFSYLYGIAGTTSVPGILDALGAGAGGKVPWRGLALIATVMVVAGLGFRIAAVPFHFYAPDVYQGTTNASAGLLAFVPKVAGFAALCRVLGFLPGAAGLPGSDALGEKLTVLVWIIAAVTMTLGNILALWQDNIRRLLAYSSIAQAGYMLMGLALVPGLAATLGVEALLFYLVAYGAMTLGAFAVLQSLADSGREAQTIDDLAGLSRTHPGLAACMLVFLLSLIGIPLTAGFMGKLQVFYAAMRPVTDTSGAADPETRRQLAEQARLYGILALVAALNAAIAAWYYLKMAVAMYLREGIEPQPKGKPRPVLAAVIVCALLTVGLGVWPKPVQDAIRAAVGTKAAPPEGVAER
ncbi:MAG: NADH-quinone oxidoreductase subunit N, partial [Gemmataceae bacterium]|nr:NADH-quinone oxidoreductase subunit N [Gemmataceae bacterium]